MTRTIKQALLHYIIKYSLDPQSAMTRGALDLWSAVNEAFPALSLQTKSIKMRPIYFSFNKFASCIKKGGDAIQAKIILDLVFYNVR